MVTIVSGLFPLVSWAVPALRFRTVVTALCLAFFAFAAVVAVLYIRRGKKGWAALCFAFAALNGTGIEYTYGDKGNTFSIRYMNAEAPFSF